MRGSGWEAVVRGWSGRRPLHLCLPKSMLTYLPTCLLTDLPTYLLAYLPTYPCLPKSMLAIEPPVSARYDARYDARYNARSE